MKWLILVAGVLANASASVLIKLAMSTVSARISVSAVLTNWQLMLGIVLYGVAFLLYALALTKFPLNVAHPVLTAGSIGVVSLFSYLIFREHFHLSTIVGLSLIVIGVFMITLRNT